MLQRTDAVATQAQVTSLQVDAAAGNRSAGGYESEAVGTDSAGMALVACSNGIAEEAHCGKSPGRFDMVVDRSGAEIEAAHSGKEG